MNLFCEERGLERLMKFAVPLLINLIISIIIVQEPEDNVVLNCSIFMLRLSFLYTIILLSTLDVFDEQNL